MDAVALRRWLPPLTLYGILAVFFGISAARQARHFRLEPAQGFIVYLSLLLLLGLFLSPGFEVTRSRVRAAARGWKRAAGCLALFLVPYLVYGAGTGDFRWTALGKLAAFCGLPLGIYAAGPVRTPDRLTPRDVVVLFWLALPVLSGWIRGIWTVPVNLDFMARLFMVSTGAWTFLIWRGTPGAGYDFRVSTASARDALSNFALFVILGMPLGLALNFIGWSPRWQGWGTLAFDFVTIFVFIAVPEELFFRGLFQNLLEGACGSRYGAQAVASALFGFSHILHAPFPNWRYVLLASIAGWFYGEAYRGTRSLMASATTHALVDTVWRTWLTRAAG